MSEETQNPESGEVEQSPPPPFDVGLANRVIQDAIKLTAEKNYDDDKIHVMRSGVEINIEVKAPDGAVAVFAGRDSELRGPENIALFRPGAWVQYLIEKAHEVKQAAAAAPSEPTEFKPFDDKDLFKKAE